ncbi:MAG: isoaspartyl peptidase/L-asparaginase family protein [Stenotrophobium sp.]
MIRLAIHGGAGDPAPGHRDTREHRMALQGIATEGLQLLRGGGTALDAVELMVLRLEECPLFNAGIGAVLNRDGLPELDAAIMRGSDRACGAVTGVMRAQSPVRLARAVMERSPHVMLMGAGAEQLNRDLGLAEVTPEYFITAMRLQQLQRARAHDAIVLDHDPAFDALSHDDDAFGTVGAVARDAQGHLAAATSTGGLTNKYPGRIGDTPVIGAGTYADDRSLAISCTGSGEYFIRACLAHDAHARMVYSGAELARACAESLAAVAAMGGRGGCIALDRAGNIAMPFNSHLMYRAWTGAEGTIRVGVEPDAAPLT